MPSESSTRDFDEFVTLMLGIFTATGIITVLVFGLVFGICQYEAGALNTLF